MELAELKMLRFSFGYIRGTEQVEQFGDAKLI